MAKKNADDMFITGGTIAAVAAIGAVFIATQVNDGELWAYLLAAVGGWLASLFIAVGIVAKGVEIGLRERDKTRTRA